MSLHRSVGMPRRFQCEIVMGCTPIASASLACPPLPSPPKCSIALLKPFISGPKYPFCVLIVTVTVIWLQAPIGINFLFMDDVTMFGKNFAAALEKKGITPSELADKIGVGRQRITHWKKRGVSARYAQAVAAKIGADPAKISNLKNLNRGPAEAQRAVSYTTDIKAPSSPRDEAAALAESLSQGSRRSLIEGLVKSFSTQDAAWAAYLFADRVRHDLEEG